MTILPAIDLKDGQCVRLVRGDFATAHKVAADPVETAKAFIDAGAAYLHCVDLDGARNGERANAAIVEALCKLPLKVELGGGLRNMQDLKTAFDMGVWRCVIGSAAVSDPEFVGMAAAEYGAAVAVGVDALDGIVRAHGWEADTGRDAFEFAAAVHKLGVQTIIFTDISTDGTLGGPPMGALKRLRELLPSVNLVASGGITTLDDALELEKLGMDGAIIGKAYYAGTLDLREVIARVG